jgi:hypothetical protein
MASAKPDPAAQESNDSTVRRLWGEHRTEIISAALIVLVAIVCTIFVLVSAANKTNAGGPTYRPTPSASSSSPSPSLAPGQTPSPSSSVDPSVPADPVPIDQPATISPGLAAEITKFEAVQGVAKTPGERSGPSVRITVTITNNTSKSVPLDTVNVTAYYGQEQTPAPELSSPGGSPLPASLAPGKTAAGVYIFRIAKDDRGHVRVEVDYSVDVQPLIFEGAVPV